MKKIVMIVCAVALSSAIHAATVGWTLAGLNNYANDAYSFFVIGQKGVTSVEQITALCASGKSVSDFALSTGSVAANGAANVMSAASGVSLDAGKTYESFFVVFDAGTQADSTGYIAITSAQNAGLTQSPKATAASIMFQGANQSTFVNTASNWSKVQGSGVPEPTSGLLLVLGCAALALRRKQK